MKRIKLDSDNYALVDNEDYDLVSKHRWKALYAGKNRYAYTTIRNKSRYMHQLIKDCPKEKEIDHIDRNGLNNQRSNLRSVSHRENLHNMRRQSIFGPCIYANNSKKIHEPSQGFSILGPSAVAATVYSKCAAIEPSSE